MMTSDYVLGVIAQFEKTSLVAMKSGARSQEGRCGQNAVTADRILRRARRRG
jgi:hypothetical protein